MISVMLLTIKEALRKRIVIAGGVMAMLFLSVLLLPGAFRNSPAGGVLPVGFQVGVISVLGISMIQFFASVMGVVMAAGSISAEIEQGTLYAIISKPLSRFSIYFGKWLGMLLLTFASIILWTGLLTSATYLREPIIHWSIIRAGLASVIYPAMFISLTLLFSSLGGLAFSSAMSLVFAGIGWSEKMLLMFGTVINLPILLTASETAGYLMPLGRMSRWIGKIAAVEIPFGVAGEGFIELPPTLPTDIAYIFLYLALAFSLGLLIFNRRDL